MLALASCFHVFLAALGVCTSSPVVTHSITSWLHKYPYYAIVSITSLFVLVSSAFVLVWCFSLMNMITQGYIYTCTSTMSPSLDATTTTTTITTAEPTTEIIQESNCQVGCSMIEPTGYILLIFMIVSLSSTIHVVIKMLLKATRGILEASRLERIAGRVDVGETTVEPRETGCRHCESSARVDTSSPSDRGALVIMSYIQLGILIYFVLYSAFQWLSNKWDDDSPTKEKRYGNTGSTKWSAILTIFHLLLVGTGIQSNEVTMRLASNLKEQVMPYTCLIAFLCIGMGILIETFRVYATEMQTLDLK